MERSQTGSAPLKLNRDKASAAVLGMGFAFLLLAHMAQAQTGGGSASLSTQIPSQSSSAHTRKVIDVEWKMGLSGQSFSNEKEQEQTTGFGLSGRLRYGLLRGLEVRAEVGANLQSGYAQSQFGDNAPRSGLILGEALVKVKPLPFFALEAGAINQAHLKSELLVAEQAFPALLQRLTFENRVFQFELKAQQAIPTSTTLSTEAGEAEVMPTFLAETVTLKARPLRPLILSVFATHFAFHDLPSAVAMGSESYGNTVVSDGPASARFRYEFEGFLAGGDAKFQIRRGLIWTIDTQILQNARADESYGLAQMVSSALTIGMSGGVDLTPGGGLFFSESDAAPAYYNSSELGHNNRAGWMAQLEAVFKKSKFKVLGRYVDADLINPTINQSRQQSISLRVETLYEVF